MNEQEKKVKNLIDKIKSQVEEEGVYEPEKDTLQIRDKIKGLLNPQQFEPDPSTYLEEEIEELIVRIKIKLLSFDEHKEIKENLNELIKKYFNKDTQNKIKNGKKSKSRGCKVAFSQNKIEELFNRFD